MLAQVNGFLNSRYQTSMMMNFTVHPKQAKYDDSLWRWIQVLVA